MPPFIHIALTHKIISWGKLRKDIIKVRGGDI